jgi:hypothetical protein
VSKARLEAFSDAVIAIIIPIHDGLDGRESLCRDVEGVVRARGADMKWHLSCAMVCLLFSNGAMAESFRCGQRIATADMTMAELLETCGEPTTKKIEVVDVFNRSLTGKGVVKVGTSTIETWTYDRGPQSFTMVVTIVDGEIKSMERGE